MHRDDEGIQPFDEYARAYARRLADALPPVSEERWRWRESIFNQARREREAADKLAAAERRAEAALRRRALAAQAAGKPLGADELRLLGEGDQS